MRLIHTVVVAAAIGAAAACTVPEARHAPSTSPADPFEDTSTTTRPCPDGTHEVIDRSELRQGASTRRCLPDEQSDKEPPP